MKLKTGQTILVGLAFLTICMFWQLYDQVVPLMLRETFGFGDVASGAIMGLDNVLAVLLFPVIGALSDRTRTPLGRRMPYILVGTLLAAFFAVLLPFADNRAILLMFMATLVLLVLAMTLYRVPAVALMADVTPKPLRSEGNAIINFMGAVGVALALGLISVLVPESAGHQDYQWVFIAVAALMVVSMVVLLLTVRENKLVAHMRDIRYGVDVFTDETAIIDNQGRERLPAEMRHNMLCILFSVTLWYMGYNAVVSAYSRYAQAVWGLGIAASSRSLLVANAGALLSFIPVGRLTKYVGRKRMVRIGVVLVAAAFAIVGLFRAFSPILYVVFIMMGVGWACINVNSYVMVVDMSRGGNIGRYTGYYYVFAMAGQVITPVLSGHLMQSIGYWTLFPYAAITVALALVTMGMVGAKKA